MKKIIIFGLGKVYRECRDYLYRNYEVIGVTSSNEEERMRHDNYISLKEIGNIEYDYIFICSYSVQEIVNVLINELCIPKNKIMVSHLQFNQNGIFHSQVNEDAICLLLLDKMGINVKEMTYVDIGTHHPVHINNTYLFYLLGAEGVLVEPNKDFKNLIEVCRPRDRLICKAISLDGEKKVFYKFKSSTLNTISYEKLDLEFSKNYEDFEMEGKCEVETITINSLFEELGRIPDLMSIDIEGCNYEVLCQMDFEKNRPKIIIAELSAWGEKQQFGNEIVSLLEQNNYVLVSRNGEINGIFVDKKYENLIEDVLYKMG